MKSLRHLSQEERHLPVDLIRKAIPPPPPVVIAPQPPARRESFAFLILLKGQIDIVADKSELERYLEIAEIKLFEIDKMGKIAIIIHSG